MDRSRVGRLSSAVDLGMRRTLTVVAALVLASCSGGGGGDGGNGLADNPSTTFFEQAIEPSAPFGASDWSASQEYLNSTGLAQLKAAEGYARRGGGLPGGQGVRIAIIDSGIDLTHPDLGNLSAISWSAGEEALVGKSHGTFVAGIAGASRTQTGNSNDMHGLAYRATLVNFQAARPSVTTSIGSISFASADLVAALNMASGLSGGSAAVESDILNLSLGAFSSSDTAFGSLRTAMRAAAAQDKIMVLAAGNEGLDADPTKKLQPIYPAAYADDTGIAGLAIVVGNLTAGNQAAASSNLCGDTRDYCLFAPGTNIRSTLDGGGYGIGSGTSFAAPYVSGAAALVKAAFPGVSSEDVVDRLLLTAEDLGDPGVDSTFGHGLLDVEAAMAPVGPVGLTIGPSVVGPMITTAQSTLFLGSAWSIGDDGRTLLENAKGFDQMGFPFPVDLGKRVVSARRNSSLRSFLATERASSARISSSQASLSVSLAEQINAGPWFDDDFSTFSERERQQRPSPQLAFSAEPGSNVTLFAALNGSSATGLGVKRALADRHWALFQSDMFLAPFDHLAGAVSGGGLVLSPYEHLKLAISAFTNRADHQLTETAIQKIEVTKTFADSIDVRLALGGLQEEGGFFGTNSSGVFGEGLNSRAQFADLSIIAALSERIDWFGSYSRGRSLIDSKGSSFLNDWSSAHAEAFAIGLSIRDMSLEGDSLNLMIGQPFRGDHAKTTLTVPVGRTPGGTVVTEQQRIDLEPSAREITSEVSYRWSFGPAGRQDIKAGGFARFNPNHDANKSPEYGIGVHYRWQF